METLFLGPDPRMGLVDWWVGGLMSLELGDSHSLVGIDPCPLDPWMFNL
jgi:hypothetical protein